MLFVGLQGSYRRGEAREDSDIDILTVLDTVDLEDLDAYRAILRRLPEGAKASGFTCGRRELGVWPAPELFQFVQDTDAYYGDLTEWVPEYTRRDTVSGARASVSALHHLGTYLYLAGGSESRSAELKAVYKGAFFAMQVVEYLRSGVYARSRSDLLLRLSGDEADLIGLAGDGDALDARERDEPGSAFRLLLEWTGNTMVALAADRDALNSDCHS